MTFKHFFLFSANCLSVGEELIFIGCADGIVRCFSPHTLQVALSLPAFYVSLFLSLSFSNLLLFLPSFYRYLSWCVTLRLSLYWLCRQYCQMFSPSHCPGSYISPLLCLSFSLSFFHYPLLFLFLFSCSQVMRNLVSCLSLTLLLYHYLSYSLSHTHDC